MRFHFIIVLILIVSCDTKYSIKGSWYTDSKDGRGHRDTVSHYVEIYANDSVIRYHEEMMGQLTDQKYYIKGDSIFKCFGTNEDCDFIPMYKIDSFKNDTIWLTVNPNYTKTNIKIFWVRLPKNELGPFDLNWTADNRDSLEQKVIMDWDRRREMFFAIKNDRLNYYDSLLKSGTWDWTMKEIRGWNKTNNH